MKTVADIAKLEFHHRQGGQFRWITITTLMLAIGTILHLVSPSVGGVTPNWTIATYCVAICLTKPSYKQALGIGLVAALVNVLTSPKSCLLLPFPEPGAEEAPRGGSCNLTAT